MNEQILDRLSKQDLAMLELKIGMKQNGKDLKNIELKLDNIVKHFFEGNGEPSALSRISVSEEAIKKIEEDIKLHKNGKWQFYSVSVASFVALLGVILMYMSRGSEALDFFKEFLPK
jgi:hypothetical protein